ncbi:type VI secretion system membrane subunit TssM, partial [Campylobacter sp. MIT 21-1685]|uniref:type VI secretion system membrane subunit TssM n=1 Tax=unclassified Campylobacter TaxID=2593542 RepID=UPI00224B2D8E
FKKILGFIKSKLFVVLLLLIFFIVLSILFWFWGVSISFNDVYIFGNPYLRFGILFILWLIVFLFFFLKPTINFFISLKSEKRAKLKALKKETNDFVFRAKRNFFISLRDAKTTWKKKIKFKKLPLIIIVGEEGAGKSTFINYSNIEYPLNDSLQSYKKFHQSTNNFSLYVSKNGALLDTEGNYFSQEKFFIPSSSDELPEDDLDKNKEFLIKKNIWMNFLNFLNKNFFHSKLDGIVLVIDTRLFLSNPKEYSKDIIRYFVKRINDCENSLNLKFPIYVVFSKIDLLEGMKEFFEIFSENIADAALGISFKEKLNADILDKELKQLSQSLFLNFINKNHFIYSLEDKNKIYLFLKQFDNLFALAKNFLLEIQNESAFKNNSFLRGVYFVSAYQENIPRNFLLDSVCEKYNIKKALAKTNPLYSKQSYFVKSLLEDIIFKDYSLSSMKNIFKKFSLLFLVSIISLSTYFLSFYFISKDKAEKEKAENTLIALRVLLSDTDYKELSIEERANLLANLKNILGVYPELSTNNNLIQYPSLNISYRGFLEAQELYYKLNEDVLKNTLLKEMEYILQTDEDDKDNLIKTLYMYKSLFEQEYLNKNLLKIWINENWQLLSKYNISKENFLNGIDGIQKINIESSNKDEKSIELAIKALQRTTTRPQRLYILLNFLNSDKQKEIYRIKEELGFAANNVFTESSKITSIDKIYTRNGMIGFLQNLNQNIDTMINTESWMLESTDSLTKENKGVLSIGILKLYLVEYQNKWEDLLSSLAPKQYNSKESMLNQLNILSKEDNPVLALIKIVSTNTKLNEASLLREAYNIGLNANEIKTHFSNITNFFNPYHKIAKQDSFLNSGASAVGLNINNDVKIMEVLGLDIKNIQTKIVEFSTNNTQSIENKIAYALHRGKEQDDPFVAFTNDIKKLPPELEKYYAKLHLYAWNLVESHGVSLFNTAWFNEVYTPFINDIAPFYPFNDESVQELSMDSFKGFFGRNGTLNRFYDKYLNSVLIKKTDTYSLNTQSDVRINFSKNFLDFMRESKNLANLMLNSNDNIKVNFTLQSLDLSGDFSFIELQYNSYNVRYDHTLNSTLQIVGEQFNGNTNLNLTVFDYHNSSLKYHKTYNGEWAWYRFLKENQNNGMYSVIFNNNEKLYFDFKLINGASEVHQILNALRQIKIVERITIGGNN